MKNFCCNAFRFHYELDKSIGLNIRIIKLSPEFIERANYKGNVYRYLLTEGYADFNDKVKRSIIEFCPYCGKELKKIYCSDEYVNEVDYN